MAVNVYNDVFNAPAACPVVCGFPRRSWVRPMGSLELTFSSWWGCCLFDIYTITFLVLFNELICLALFWLLF